MEKIDRYEIIRKIGKGGMATVYLAQDPHFEREIAIKLLPRELLKKPKLRQRFDREAKTIARLEHPAIVPVYDYGEFEGLPYIAMRYMAGGSLEARMKKGTLGFNEILSIIERVADALDEAHQEGVIHRDLKPGNILFDQRNLAYLGDFGIAKFQIATSELTGTNIVGTPAYMSPEQAIAKSVLDGRSDLYSLGVVCFEMLTGQKPFEADTPMGTALAHINDPVPDIRDFQQKYTESLSRVLQTALAKDRSERFRTCHQFFEALSVEQLSITVAADKSEKTIDDLLIPEAVAEAAPEIREHIDVKPEPQERIRGSEEDQAPAKKRSFFLQWRWVGIAALVIGILWGIQAIDLRESPDVAPLATETQELETQTAAPTLLSTVGGTDDPEPQELGSNTSVTFVSKSEIGSAELGNSGCADWDSCRSATSCNYFVDDMDEATVGASDYEGEYLVNRIFLRFDTAAIPTTARINSATFHFHTGQWQNGDNTVHIVQTKTNSDINCSEFDNVIFSSGGHVAPKINSWNSIQLSGGALGWINRGEITTLVLINSFDLSNTVPSSRNDAVISMPITGIFVPHLEISYTIP